MSALKTWFCKMMPNCPTRRIERIWRYCFVWLQRAPKLLAVHVTNGYIVVLRICGNVIFSMCMYVQYVIHWCYICHMAKAIGLYAAYTNYAYIFNVYIYLCLSNTFKTVWFMTHMTLSPSLVQSVLCCHTRSLRTQQIVFGFSKTSSVGVSKNSSASAIIILSQQLYIGTTNFVQA